MEKTLVETHFGKITLDLDNLLVKQIFIDNGQEIEDTEFYEFMEAYVNSILNLHQTTQNQLPALKMLVDVRNTDFVILPKMQEDISQNLFSRLERKMQKIAFIQPKDLFASVSIQQMIDEDTSEKIPVEYFDNEADALKWLKV